MKSNGGDWTVGTGEPGPITMELRRTLLALQGGQHPDTHGWMHKIV